MAKLASYNIKLINIRSERSILVTASVISPEIDKAGNPRVGNLQARDVEPVLLASSDQPVRRRGDF